MSNIFIAVPMASISHSIHSTKFFYLSCWQYEDYLFKPEKEIRLLDEAVGRWIERTFGFQGIQIKQMKNHANRLSTYQLYNRYVYFTLFSSYLLPHCDIFRLRQRTMNIRQPVKAVKLKALCKNITETMLFYIRVNYNDDCMLRPIWPRDISYERIE